MTMSHEYDHPLLITIHSGHYLQLLCMHVFTMEIFSEGDGKMQGSGRNMDDEEEMTKVEKTEVKKWHIATEARRGFMHLWSIRSI